MSKEQTPITADQQTIKDLWNAKSASEIAKILSDYKKRVVLEALEREVPKAFETGYNNALNNCEYFDGADVPSLTSDEDEYYKTEVKPKYER